MDRATLTKWDAAVVGESPPIGRWVRKGREVRVTTRQPHRWLRACGRLLGYEWVLGVDARNTPGCIEIIEIHPGREPEVWSKHT